MAVDGFDWAAFESELTSELKLALGELGKSQADEPFYVVALYGVHRSLDGLLSLPLLGANTACAAPSDDEGDFWAERWNPYDWAFGEIDLREAEALRLERALTQEATSGSQEQWRRTERRYFDMLVRVAGTLRDEAPDLLDTCDDFVAFLHDEEGGPELARQTIPQARFDVLFAVAARLTKEKARVANLPPDERAAFLVTRLGVYDGISSEEAQRQLFGLGEVAVPHLVAIVDDPKNGWVAAKLLGSIGYASGPVLEELRGQALESGGWFAMALGMLGDNEWLAAAATPRSTVAGLTAPLKAICTSNRRPALSYAALTAYLDGADSATHALAEEALAPGSSYVGIGVDDVDEALDALSSDHAVVRWHAASLLGDRGLGAAAGARILPALAARLADEHPTVRRLALLAMSYWKIAAAPYRDAMAELAGDPDEVVQRIALHVLGET